MDLSSSRRATYVYSYISVSQHVRIRSEYCYHDQLQHEVNKAHSPDTSGSLLVLAFPNPGGNIRPAYKVLGWFGHGDFPSSTFIPVPDLLNTYTKHSSELSGTATIRSESDGEQNSHIP
jgi:hypothetical protein